MTNPKQKDICVGVLLAGGQARRMGGGDKCLRDLAGKPLLSHVIERAQPQVGALLLNSNSNQAKFEKFGLPHRADVVGDFAGPLAGILTGLEWAAETKPDAVWLASFATDAPFLPEDLVERLLGAVEDSGAVMACAKSHGRSHPVFGLWPIAYRAGLRRALVEEDIRKVDRWTSRYQLSQVAFPDCELPSGPVDPFFNTNRPEDLAQAETLLAATA